MTDMKQAILEAARPMVQARGYNALSFRDIAAGIGIKSASVHYHFPTKGDLGAALARRYTEAGKAYLDALVPGASELSALLTGFIDIFRRALLDDNRMCLVGIMAAEHHDLPAEVRVEVARFTDVCVEWLASMLSAHDAASDGNTVADRALSIFAAIQGAQLVARGKDDVGLFDRIIAAHRASGLIP